MPAPVVLVLAYLAGALPFSYLVARLVAHQDLREHGTGTVSGTGLFEVAGFGPLVVGGVLDVAKGAVGPLLAGSRPVLAAFAAIVAVIGHDWSPFLKGAGGRGISPAMGALAVVAWPGSLVLLAGLALGKLASNTGLGSFLAQTTLPVVTWLTFGGAGLLGGAGVVVVLWTKRLVGNEPPERGDLRVLASRLLYDHDEGFRSDPRPA
jgi:glycerol-3-phosphate acyltransferase PlsY